MKSICKKCGCEFIPTISFFRTKQLYCLKCSKKGNLPTQQELAKRAHREFSDKVQAETDKADAEKVSYGVHMARRRK